MTGVLFVSPHLDDAVLSCGATMSALEPGTATVVTVFGGAGPPVPLSPFAARYHDIWGWATTAADGIALRRREDTDACGLLGAACVHLDFAEAPYRTGADGTPRCRHGGDLFSPLGPGDEAVVDAVRQSLTAVVADVRPATVYAPAAIGDHLDHRIVREAGVAAVAALPPAQRPELLLYEDLPYAADPDEAPAAALLDTVAGVRLHRADPAALDRKLAAVRAYASQLHMLVLDDEPLERVLVRHALHIGGGVPAERAWAPGLRIGDRHSCDPPTEHEP